MLYMEARGKGKKLNNTIKGRGFVYLPDVIGISHLQKTYPHNYRNFTFTKDAYT